MEKLLDSEKTRVRPRGENMEEAGWARDPGPEEKVKAACLTSDRR